jgi:MGT family glycosyltransferase
MIAARTNPLRATLGLPPVRTLDDIFLAASRVIAFTAEPFEYPRSDWPAAVRLVGPGLWEPPAMAPEWLEDLHDPLILVTCSTLFQNDRPIIEVACAALTDEPYDVVITTGDVDVTGIAVPANVRLVPFAPHTPLLERAACVVCHAGMGITQKALAHGVPVVAIPFGRDQPEVARRVEVAGAGVRLPARALRADRLRDAVSAAMRRRPAAERLAVAFAASGGPGAGPTPSRAS